MRGAGERLYDRTCDELGTPYADVLEAIAARRRRARSIIAQHRLADLEWQFCQAVITRYL